MSADGVQADYLEALFGNGPVACGAVVDQDTFTATKDGLRLGGTPRATIGAVHAALTRVVSSRVAAICAAGAGLLHAHGPIRDRKAVSDTDPVWVTVANAGGSDRVPEVFTIDSLQEATLVALRFVVAAKVNYWKTNHHTGSPKPAGYFLKALKLSGLDAVSESDISALWRLVHWADTRVILSVLGIRGLNAKEERIAAAKKLLSPTDDVILRIRSAPAGTAKWADVWAGIKALEGSPMYAMVGPVIGSTKEECARISDAISGGDPSFHMGALYLCGRQRTILPEWSPIVVSWVRTCLEDFDASSTLLRASVFLHVEPTASMIRQIKKIVDANSEGMESVTLGLTWSGGKGPSKAASLPTAAAKAEALVTDSEPDDDEAVVEAEDDEETDGEAEGSDEEDEDDDNEPKKE